MPQVLSPFPNPVLAIRELLTPLADTGTRTPGGSWNGDPPFLRVRIVGGRDDGWTDLVRFDVDAITNSGHASDDLAELVRQRLIAAPHVLTETVLDNVTTDTRPHQVPWGDNPVIFNATAAYAATFRRNRTP